VSTLVYPFNWSYGDRPKLDHSPSLVVFPTLLPTHTPVDELLYPDLAQTDPTERFITPRSAFRSIGNLELRLPETLKAFSRNQPLKAQNYNFSVRIGAFSQANPANFF
jgi:hypothetical protein